MKGWRNRFAKTGASAEKVRWRARFWKFCRGIKTWQLLLILLIFTLLTAIFLRLNNLNMLDRANALKAVVAAGQPVDMATIQQKSQELQNYVAHHMNTTTGRIALQNVYDQAFLAVVQANSPKSFAGSDYNAATNSCMPAFRASGYRAWANCVSAAVGTSDADLEAIKTAAPDPNAYYIEYAPARWSFDAAGVSLFICCILVIVIAARLISLIILRIILKIKYRAA